MNWRELLGLRPRIEDFAALLLRHVPTEDGATWTFDPAESSLRSSTGSHVNLTNIFLEYVAASRAGRKLLVEKYVFMLGAKEREVPELWSLAAKGIVLAVRSKYDYLTLEIESRTAGKPIVDVVTWPFAGDLCLRLLYDFGPSMLHVGRSLLTTWGQDEAAVYEQALKNLKSLQRPAWTMLVDGVYKIVSEVAYEESFLLIAAVVDQLPFAQSAVLMSTNRGILLAADANSIDGLSAMLHEAFSSLQNSPWPVSGMMLARQGEQWSAFKAEGIVARQAHVVNSLNIASIYSDQKAALEKHFEKTGEDVFVATFELRQQSEQMESIISWCVWTETVRTLLPKSDHIALVKGELETPDAPPESLVVSWEEMLGVCGRYLQATTEDPIRFEVTQFPSAEEWERLKQLAGAAL